MRAVWTMHVRTVSRKWNTKSRGPQRSHVRNVRKQWRRQILRIQSLSVTYPWFNNDRKKTQAAKKQQQRTQQNQYANTPEASYELIQIKVDWNWAVATVSTTHTITVFLAYTLLMMSIERGRSTGRRSAIEREGESENDNDWAREAKSCWHQQVTLSDTHNKCHDCSLIISHTAEHSNFNVCVFNICLSVSFPIAEIRLKNYS